MARTAPICSLDRGPAGPPVAGREGVGLGVLVMADGSLTIHEARVVGGGDGEEGIGLHWNVSGGGGGEER